jgi:hypothetical protein
MTYEKFLKVVLSLQKQDAQYSILYKNGVDLIEFTELYHIIIDALIEEIYGKEGLDWFGWFCYENKFGQGGLEAFDENKNRICYSHESLWQFLESLKS